MTDQSNPADGPGEVVVDEPTQPALDPDPDPNTEWEAKAAEQTGQTHVEVEVEDAVLPVTAGAPDHGGRRERVGRGHVDDVGVVGHLPLRGEEQRLDRVVLVPERLGGPLGLQGQLPGRPGRRLRLGQLRRPLAELPLLLPDLLPEPLELALELLQAALGLLPPLGRFPRDPAGPRALGRADRRPERDAAGEADGVEHQADERVGDRRRCGEWQLL